MAKNNFNFQVKAGLDVRNFNKGVNKIQASIAKLKAAFMSFAGGIGIGLGFEKFISNVKDTAVNLDTAKNTLRNVSNVTKTLKTSVGDLDVTIDNYSSNLEYVRDLSNEYGQDLVTLISNFAKFTAAAKGTSLGLEDQKLVYESLVRASATYHLSADKTNDVMNAVVQMMSKGKIVAEELRRQLGNNLPGAFNIMAAAVGVSTSELDKMMANGELLADKYLPKFAMELNRITANASFDSLQTSLNRFKNEWYELVESSNADVLFKKLVDKSTSALDNIGKNFKSYLGGATGLLIGLLAGPQIAKAFVNASKFYKNYRANAEAEIAAIEARIKSLKAELAGLGRMTGLGGFFTDSDAVGATSEQIKKMKEVNDLIIKEENLQNSLGQTTVTCWSTNTKKIGEASGKLGIMAKEVAKNESQILKNAGAWKRFTHGVNLGVTKVVGSIKKMGQSLVASLGPIGLITIGITAISTIWGVIKGKIEDARREQERLNNIVNGVDDRIGERIAPAQSDIKKVADLKRGFDELGKAGDKAGQKLMYTKIQEIVPALSDITYEDLCKKADGFEQMAEAIKNWADSLSSGSEMLANYMELGDLMRQQDDLKKDIDKLQNSGNPKTEQKMVLTGSTNFGGATYSFVDALTEEGQLLKDKEQELQKVTEAIEDVKEKISKIKVVEEVTPVKNANEDLLKIYKDSTKALKELERQKREGAITDKEFAEEYDSIVRKYYQEASNSGELVLETILSKLKAGKALTKLEQWYLDLHNKTQQAIANASARQMEEENKRLAEQAQKAREEFDRKFKDGEYNVKETTPRNTRLDYKKTQFDITSEKYEEADEKIKNLQDSLEKLQKDYKKIFKDDKTHEEALRKIEEMNKELKFLKANATAWSEAMALEEMIQDLQEVKIELKSLYKELGDEIWGDFTSVVGSIESIYNAFKRIEDLSKDKDATGWDKFFASFSAFETIMNTLIGTMETFNNIMEISNSIKDAQTAKTLALNAAKAQEVALDTAATAVKTAAAAAATDNAAATAAETSASIAKTSAKSGEAIADATASGAKMQFPLNLFAIAAGVSAVIAALASISKFEKGGIVGGSSTHGDKNMVRINAGEMVLNKTQQGTLYRAIASGNLGGGGGGEWRVRGTDLIKVINNTQSKLRG